MWTKREVVWKPQSWPHTCTALHLPVAYAVHEELRYTTRVTRDAWQRHQEQQQQQQEHELRDMPQVTSEHARMYFANCSWMSALALTAVCLGDV
jgi:hypothetical protein